MLAVRQLSQFIVLLPVSLWYRKGQEVRGPPSTVRRSFMAAKAPVIGLRYLHMLGSRRGSRSVSRLKLFDMSLSVTVKGKAWFCQGQNSFVKASNERGRDNDTEPASGPTTKSLLPAWWGKGGSWIPKPDKDIDGTAKRWFEHRHGLPWNLQSYLQQEVQLLLGLLRLQLWWLERLQPQRLATVFWSWDQLATEFGRKYILIRCNCFWRHCFWCLLSLEERTF